MKPMKLTLPLMEAIEACAAVLPHVSKDDITPALTVAVIEGDRIIATDRFTVGAFKLSASLKSGKILLPHAAVQHLATFPTKTLIDIDLMRLGMRDPETDYTVTIEAVTSEPVDDEPAGAERPPVKVAVCSKKRGAEQTRQFRHVKAKPPPVGRMIEDFTPGEIAQVRISPEMLEKFTRYAKKWHPRQPLMFTHSVGGKKPGPLRVAIGKFEGLLQPNLMLDREER